MKNILTIAMIALSVGAFAQQRQLVKQQDYRTQTNVRYINNSQYQTSKYSFSRLDLTNRQERQLVDLLKDKENEERSIMRKYRNPEQKLRLLDREYDRKIQNLMSRSQYDKWTKIYAYQYEAYGNKRWS
jgi:Spy/CpxP family protein refolding chaperone|nr:hypothetical protein [uncultured Flavobacterium sp.]